MVSLLRADEEKGCLDDISQSKKLMHMYVILNIANIHWQQGISVFSVFRWLAIVIFLNNNNNGSLKSYNIII